MRLKLSGRQAASVNRKELYLSNRDQVSKTISIELSPNHESKIAGNLRLCPSASTAAKEHHDPLLCHPERSRGTCGAPFPQTTACDSFSHYLLSHGNATPPLVIPPAPACRGSAAEGPAVQRTFRGNVLTERSVVERGFLPRLPTNPLKPLRRRSPTEAKMSNRKLLPYCDV
jgi:hypothetical protein